MTGHKNPCIQKILRKLLKMYCRSEDSRGGACGFFVGTLALREKGAAVLSSKAVKKLFH